MGVGGWKGVGGAAAPARRVEKESTAAQEEKGLAQAEKPRREAADGFVYPYSYIPSNFRMNTTTTTTACYCWARAPCKPMLLWGLHQPSFITNYSPLPIIRDFGGYVISRLVYLHFSGGLRCVICRHVLRQCTGTRQPIMPDTVFASASPYQYGLHPPATGLLAYNDAYPAKQVTKGYSACQGHPCRWSGNAIVSAPFAHPFPHGYFFASCVTLGTEIFRPEIGQMNTFCLEKKKKAGACFGRGITRFVACIRLLQCRALTYMRTCIPTV